MATPKKTKSGKWHTLVYSHTENGKRIYESITADTKAQCEYLAGQFKVTREPTKQELTLRSVVNQYIDSVRSVLSITTIETYEKIANHAFPQYMDMCVEKLDNLVAQQMINDECKRLNYYGKPLAPKTIHSEYGLISTSLKKVCNKSFDVSLPQMPRKIKRLASPADIIPAIKGMDIELPCLLAMWLSYTMSEIKGIHCASIHDGIIRIEQVMVSTREGDVLKPTAKEPTRLRIAQIPPYIMSLINESIMYRHYLETGENCPLIPLTRNYIYKHWKRIAEENGWNMSFHDLRAVSASVMGKLRIPDKVAEERGGWSTDTVMKKVYMSVFDDDRLEADEKINNYFEGLL